MIKFVFWGLAVWFLQNCSLNIETGKVLNSNVIQFLVCNAGHQNPPKNSCHSPIACQFNMFPFWYIQVLETLSDNFCYCTFGHLNQTTCSRAKKKKEKSEVELEWIFYMYQTSNKEDCGSMIVVTTCIKN